MKRLLLLFIFLFIIVISVACSNSNEDEQVQSNDQETEQSVPDNEESTETDEARDEDTNLNHNENEASDDQQARRTANQGAKDLPEPIVLNEQIQHPDGIVFVLEQITFKEDHILVDFNAENHSGYYQHLASAGEAKGTDLGGITLEDDTGFVYRYIAEDNSRIKLKDREKVTGTVSFTGTIQDDATSITLIFNPDFSPEFVFEDLELVR